MKLKYIITALFVICTTCIYSQIISIPGDYPTIQEGINAANNGDTVLVDPGTYVENINFNGKNITVGSQYLITQDSSYISQTIIDGNYNGSVVTFENGEDSTAVLSGFKITQGDATQGGGIYCYNSSPNLCNLLIRGNQVAFFGAGIYCENSSPILINMKIIENNTEPLDGASGGGLYCLSANPILTNVHIIANSAGDFEDSKGGGIYCNNSSPILTNVSIINNSVNTFTHSGDGAGFYCENNSSPVFTDVLISGNEAGGGDWGGGVVIVQSEASFQNVTITNNKASGGGGIGIENSIVNMTNVNIVGNISYTGSGGGISVGSSTIELIDVYIFNNLSYGCGGGIECEASELNFNGCTIRENCTNYLGGGIYIGQNSIINFTNNNSSSIYLNHASLEGNDLYSYCTEIIDVVVDTFSVISPDNYFAYPIEKYSFNILNPAIIQAEHDLYVSPDGSDDNSGISFDDPLKTISRALSKIKTDSMNSRTIYLDSGIFSPDSTNDLFPLNVKNFVSLNGSITDSTILQGSGQSGIISLHYDFGVSINGLSLQNCNTADGTGISSTNSELNISNLIIKNNILGLYSFDSDVSIANTIIKNNSSDGNYFVEGGGIYIEMSHLIITNTLIKSNYASLGGGIFCENSEPTLVNVTFMENGSTSGGGMYCKDSEPTLINTTFIENVSSESGGGVYCKNSEPTLINATLVGNVSGWSGGAIYCRNSHPKLINTINWENSISFEWTGQASSIEVLYSDIEGGETGIETNNNGVVYWLEGNIDEDPLFIDSGEHPFQLTGNSPCIDTGIPDTSGLNLCPLDLLGNLRIWDGDGNGDARIDMGAYEFGSIPLGKKDLNLENSKFELKNYPNPFKSVTTITYSLPRKSIVTLDVISLKGQPVCELLNEVQSAGKYKVVFDKIIVPPGIYFCTLKTNTGTQTKKIIKL